MDTSNEYRSYGSYLSRVFAIIIVVVLMLMAVWFVVQVATDNDDDSAKDTETSETVASEESTPVANTPSVSVLDDTNGEQVAVEVTDGVAIGDIFSGVSEDDSQVLEADEGYTLSTNTDDLPETGAGDFMWMLVIPGVTFAGLSYKQSLKELETSF